MKVCSLCGIPKDENYFRFRNRGRGIRHSQCKDCARGYGKEFYKLNKEDRIALSFKRVMNLRLQNLQNLVEYLFRHPCVDCGETDPIVLDFDHVVEKDKLYNVSQMVGSYSWETILSEISKCVIRCSNCHRRKTAKTRGRTKLLIIEDFKSRKPIV